MKGELKKKYQFEDSDYELSLTKLTGKKIVDVVGYVCKEFGGTLFQVTSIVLEGGERIFVEGEHDIVYATESVSLDEELIEKIYKEEE
jgi:hypothetical protein